MTDFPWMGMVLLGAVLVSVLSLAVAVVALALLQSHRAAYAESQQRLQRELRVLQSGAVGMGKRLLMLEQQLAGEAAARSIDHPPLTSSMSEQMQDAVSLLQAGLAADEVARRCGISKAEAALMKLMQSPRTHAAA